MMLPGTANAARRGPGDFDAREGLPADAQTDLVRAYLKPLCCQPARAGQAVPALPAQVVEVRPGRQSVQPEPEDGG